MNSKILSIKLAGALLACSLAPEIAMAQIGGGIGVGVGGIDVEITIGDGDTGGDAPSGAPLPLLGGTLLGHAALLGAGYVGWRRRSKKLNQGTKIQQSL